MHDEDDAWDWIDEPDEEDFQVFENCKVIHLTEKAMLVERGNERAWVPLAAIVKGVGIVGEVGDLLVNEWFEVEWKVVDW